MAVLFLFCLAHLCEGFACARKVENGIIAKAAAASGLSQDLPRAGALGLERNRAIRFCDHKRAYKLGVAVFAIAEFPEQAIDAVLVAVAVAGRKNTRSPVERIDLEPRVVGDGPMVGCDRNLGCFQPSIFEKRSAGFRHLDFFRFKRQLPVKVAQMGLHFFKFARVACRDNNGCHSKKFQGERVKVATVKILWFVIDFMPALGDQAAAEPITTQIFLEFMDCSAVGNLKRLTQANPDAADLTHWAPGILKVEIYLPRLQKVIEILQTHLQAPVIFYVEVQGVQKTVEVDLQPAPKAVTTNLLSAVGDLLGIELGTQD